jgi:predicted AAA+ superfamily ATPase
VDRLTMYPLDFEEFLWATDHRALSDLIRDCCTAYRPLSLHDTAMDLYRTYLVVGGMPQAVAQYAANRDFDFVLATQKALGDAYIADMAKYASPQETTRILAAWRSIPAQLAKENHKFQYKLIKTGGRAHEFELPLEWLQTAGLIHKCVRVSEGKMPLSAYADPSAFKVYVMDTGLLCSKFDIAANVVLSSPHSFDGFKGALAENYIMQALITGGFQPYYWASQGKAELDFVFQTRQGDIIPLEGKSAENVRAKSLRTYADAYHLPYQIRVSGRNFGKEGSLISLPLYALFCLEK